MADTPDSQKPTLLAPAVVRTIKDEDVTNAASMERSVSMDMRKEREDLKAAAEQSLNVILDLGFDGIIRWVSPSWKDVVGTPPESVKGKPIADLLLSSKDGFANAVESMKKDDSKSRIIRFRLQMGPDSVLKEPAPEKAEDNQDETQGDLEKEGVEEEQVVNLEGQGIIVYDRSTGADSHTMWMLRPSTPPREVTIDLPELLVESLGTGAEFLAQYLTELAETGASDPKNHPSPLPVLCRICERQITPWWFEKHTEGCTQEYRAESEVSLAQDALTEHRPAIVKVLDALDPESRQGRPVSGELVIPVAPTAEYKGLPIGPAKTSPMSSGSAGKGTPAGTPPTSRDSSVSGLGHTRGKSFAVRRPLSKIVTLLVDLCDTALDISMPAIKACNEGEDGFRSQSPPSESRISQVLNWQTPSVATSEHEQGLSALITDTEHLAQAKVDTVLRYREILEYTERIRVEFNALVLDCIDAAIKKASSIKAGDISSSSDEEDEDGEEDGTQHDKQETVANEENAVSAYDGSPAMVSSMATALRDISDHSIVASERRQSSIPASSTRSSSPAECPTPRSHRNTLSFLGRSDSVNKRTSTLLGSDAGDSDTGMSHSAIITHRRVESPGSDAHLVRSASSGERKRRSLRLPNLPSPGRNPSPARGPPPPASPLRIPKPRLPLSLDSVPSPVTSPPLSSTEHSSPIPTSLRHRRESSAASSIADLSKPPPSPRLNSMSQPPARAAATSIKDFEIIKPISKGAFGSVYLAKKRSTGDYFAMKCLRKGDMVAKNQVTNVKAERAIMMWQGESDFVAKLYWTFASRDFLFLVMEYLNGGDCASLVKVLGSLPEDWAKKYLAEVVLGIEHLHSRGIVHRDLKPDNLLIDQKGHLKLTDFGLSRMGLIGRQKRALTEENESAPDLFKQGPFARATSIGSSRSASFDFQAAGGHSPNSTPMMTPDLAGSLGQPSYFNLNRDPIPVKRHSRRESGYRSDSGNSDSFNAMFRNFSLNDETLPRGESIAEETYETDLTRSQSPDMYPLRPIVSNQSVGSHQGDREGTPPLLSSIMPPPPMALFDPDDENRRFVGTPDYLAPETINGLGQDEMSDWWSLGCILFEFLYGYPPFHGETPDIVFENILNRKIDWPDKDYAEVSEDAKDLMDKLMTIDPKARLGSNMAEKFPSAGEEIRAHSWFNGINWNTLLEDEALFVPQPENPEDTEYFDARGATLQTFTEEMEGQESSPNITPGTDNYERPHDALSRVRSQVNSMKRGLMPLHIPPHVRDNNRNRRLSEPVANDDFGNFAFKNLPVLEKANKEVIQKMRVEAQQKTIRGSGGPSQPTSAVSMTPSLEGSPLLAGPLKRTLSANKGPIRPSSPSNLPHANPSPNRTSQPSSPLVSFSTGQSHERRKTSSSSSVLSHQSSNSLQPGSAMEPPKLATGFSATSASSMAPSPVRTNRHSANMSIASPEKTSAKPSRPHSMHIPTSRARSQTVGSADGDLIPAIPAVNPKRHSQVFDVSPSSSDTEDRAQALLRVQRRRQSSRSVSKIILSDGPTFRPLDILICEDHPVSRIVMEKLFEKLKCRTIVVNNGPEAARFAMGKVQFDIILMEYKLPHINGADVARMIRDTKSANTQTPIVAVTGYLRELPQTHHFDSLIEKPPTVEKLTEVLGNLCQWKPPPPGYVAPKPIPQGHGNAQSGLRQESRQSKDDSPSSQSSGPFSHVPGLYNPTSREHSIGSSFFGDTDSANTDDSCRADIPVIIGRQSDDWAPNNALGITEDPTTSATTFIDKHFIHPGLPHLLHQNSAPSVMSDPRTPRKQRSAEAVKAKREDLLKKRHECAESGDDEDEELGDVQVRARSPVGKIRSKAAATSKLGTEMMRTNSRGSVSSTGGGHDDGALTKIPSVTSVPSPPSTAAAAATITTGVATKDVSTTDVTRPPEIFPAISKGDAEAFVDMDATPRPPATAAIASIEQAPKQESTPSPSPVKST